MQKNRITVDRLQRFSIALSGVIQAAFDHRARFGHRAPVSMRGFGGTSRFVKDLLALPHGCDYTPFEVQLKRRIVRMNHKVLGRTEPQAEHCKCLHSVFPRGAYEDQLSRYEKCSTDLLKALADVDIKSNHQALQTVQQLRAASALAKKEG